MSNQKKKKINDISTNTPRAKLCIKKNNKYKKITVSKVVKLFDG